MPATVDIFGKTNTSFVPFLLPHLDERRFLGYNIRKEERRGKMEEKEKTSGILRHIALFLLLYTLLSFAASLASSAGDTLLWFCLHILSYLLPGVLLMRTQQKNGVVPKRPTGNFRAALPLFPILLAAMIFLSSLTALLLGAFGIANMWFAIFADVGVMILAVLNAIRCMFPTRPRHIGDGSCVSVPM